MVQVFNMPIATAFKNNGLIGPGYKLFFYEADSVNTKKTVYADDDLTTPLSNPVVADANGRFPQIFLAGNGEDYKAVYTADTDSDPPTSPIWTADPVDTNQSDINDFSARPFQHWGTTTGTSSAYKIDPDEGISSYNDKLVFSVQIHTDNTLSGGNTTFEVADSDNPGQYLSPLNAKKYNAGNKVGLEAGDLEGGGRYIATIDGVDIIFLNPEKPYLNPANFFPATTSQRGVSYLPSSPITITNNASDPNNDFDLGAGNFIVSDGSAQGIATAKTKRADATWAAGTNQGGMAAGVTKSANGTYHTHLLLNPTTGATDFGYDSSVTATNLLADSAVVAAGFTKYKRYFSWRADGSANIRIGTYKVFVGGYEFNYATEILDANTVALTTSRVSLTLTTPSSVRVKALLHAAIVNDTAEALRLYEGGSSIMNGTIEIQSNAVNTFGTSASFIIANLPIPVWTNTSNQIDWSVAVATATCSLLTHGWIDYTN